MKKLKEAIEEFHLSNEGSLSPSTVSWYSKMLKELETYFGENKYVEEITVKQLREYRKHLLKRKKAKDHKGQGELSRYSVHANLRAVRRLFNWLFDEEIIQRNPFKKIRMNRVPNKEPKAISEADFTRMLEISPIRERAIILMLADTGCRVGGLVSITLDTLNLEGNYCLVTEKGERVRRVYYSDLTKAAIIDWLEVREERNTQKLFTGQNGPLSTSGVYQALRRLAKQVGVERFSPHSFRHAAARNWLRNGADLATVSQLLGHKSVTVTAKYYTRWADSELSELHKRYSWISNSSKKE